VINQQDPSIDEPWRLLEPAIGELIRPHVAALSDEVIAAIRERVPAYHRPLRGRFGAGIRQGVEVALTQFADLVADPELDRSDLDAVYRGLGAGEYREHRSLDALLAAYRLGARVSWRRVSELAMEAGHDRRTLAILAEAVFAYIDEVSALSAEGYAQAQSAAAGESERLRARVAELLLEPATSADAITAAAAEAGWELPRQLAALAWSGDGAHLRTRLPTGTPATEVDGDNGIAFVSDPDAPGLRARVDRAAHGESVVFGPTVAATEAATSAARARDVLRLIDAGVIVSEGLTLADDHLGALIAHGDEPVLTALARRRLQPLDGETPASRRRLAETLRSWLDHQGEVARVAAELGVHPQTVRYRLARLRELFGEALERPDERFELSLALRAPVSSASAPGRS
jgi:hypothetical protein